MQPDTIKLVICWHMHQPHYRDGLDGQYRLPWVYLHGIKDYSDMVAHLEDHPDARVVVNFAPVLLEQLEDYAVHMQRWLEDGTGMGDPLLNCLSGAQAVGDDIPCRFEVIQACKKAYAPTMIDVFPPFRALLDMVQSERAQSIEDAQYLRYFSDQMFVDLLVWYHLAWMGESLRRKDERVQALIGKGMSGQSFDLDARRLLVEIMADVMEQLVPRYRALEERGQIEISMTPYGHPIVPLMIDFNSARDAMPEVPLPEHTHYPDGYGRALWHLKEGMDQHQRYFGKKPQGVWLSEGAVSASSVGLLDSLGVRWTASGEGVWRHSCEASRLDPHDISSKRALYRPLQHGDQRCALFFRDDGMSDLIGFEYKNWQPQDAANNFAHNLENIANHLGDRAGEHVVTVILDGENPWEYYPNNGHDFISALYRTLADHPRVEMTTFTQALDQGLEPIHLPVLKAGSWVYGSFSTWIGENDKNAGWDMLVEAKHAYDRVIASGELSRSEQEAATHQLAVCEGSDWFWWFGDYNPADSVRDFAVLYRRHLEKLYLTLKLTPPDSLRTLQPSGGGHMENSGTMRRN